MGGEELADLYYRTCEAADALHARADDILELTERLEGLTEGDDDAWYAGTRVRVEARAALEQAPKEPWRSWWRRMFGLDSRPGRLA